MKQAASTPIFCWPAAPGCINLLPGEIHVWAASLVMPDEPYAVLAHTLSDDERSRASHYAFERDCRRFVAARGTLREILGRYLNLAPAQVSFEYSSRGKPSLSRDHRVEGLHFNVSHSENLALYAIALAPQLGIDVEWLRDLDDMEQIARWSFSPREQAVFESLPTDRKPAAFFRCWTRKEAFIKAAGTGLAQPLDQFDVSFVPDEPARFLWIAGEPDEHLYWSLWNLAPALGYMAATATRQNVCRLRCWTWAPTWLNDYRRSVAGRGVHSLA